MTVRNLDLTNRGDHYSMYVAEVGTTATVVVPSAGNSNPQGNYRHSDYHAVEITKLIVTNYQASGDGANLTITLGTDNANTYLLANSNVIPAGGSHEWNNIYIAGPLSNLTATANFASNLTVVAFAIDRPNLP